KQRRSELVGERDGRAELGRRAVRITLRGQYPPQRRERPDHVLAPADVPGELQCAPAPRDRVVQPAERELHLCPVRREASAYQPALPRLARYGLFPESLPRPLDRREIALQELRAHEIRARVEP